MSNQDHHPPDRARLSLLLRSIDDRLADVKSRDAALVERRAEISDRFSSVRRGVRQSSVSGVIGLVVGIAIIAVVRMMSPTLANPWPIALVALGALSAILGVWAISVSWQARGRLLREEQAQMRAFRHEQRSLDELSAKLHSHREHIATDIAALDRYDGDDFGGGDVPPF